MTIKIGRKKKEKKKRIAIQLKSRKHDFVIKVPHVVISRVVVIKGKQGRRIAIVLS